MGPIIPSTCLTCPHPGVSHIPHNTVSAPLKDRETSTHHIGEEKKILWYYFMEDRNRIHPAVPLNIRMYVAFFLLLLAQHSTCVHVCVSITGIEARNWSTSTSICLCWPLTSNLLIQSNNQRTTSRDKLTTVQPTQSAEEMLGLYVSANHGFCWTFSVLTT